MAFGGGSPPGGALQAFDLGLELDAAQAAGVAIAGLALDWSKCYDRMLLALLQQLAWRARLPLTVWRPMVDAYASPRFVCVGGMAGKAVDLVRPGAHTLACAADALLACGGRRSGAAGVVPRPRR